MAVRTMRRHEGGGGGHSAGATTRLLLVWAATQAASGLLLVLFARPVVVVAAAAAAAADAAAAAHTTAWAPPSPSVPVLDAAAREFFAAWDKAAYAPSNAFGVKTAAIVNGLVAQVEAHTGPFREHARDCKQLEASTLRGLFRLGSLAQAVQDHCDHDVVHALGGPHCTSIIGQHLANATGEAMLASGSFGPDVVATMECALHRLLRDHHAGPPTGESVGATAFADAFAADGNRTVCVDSSGSASDARAGGDDPVAEELCLGRQPPSCSHGESRQACCVCGGGQLVDDGLLDYERLRRKTLVFVSGAHYSGTSLLEAVLDTSPLTSAFHRTDVPENEGQHLQDVFPDGTQIGSFSFGCDPRAYFPANSTLVSQASARRLWTQWARWWDPHKHVYLEKSPQNVARLPFLQAMFKDAERVVALVSMKNPLSLWLSHAFRKHKKTLSGYSKARLLEHFEKNLRCWFTMHDNLKQALPQVRHFRVLRFEDFMIDVRGTLAELEVFLGLPPLNVTISEALTPKAYRLAPSEHAKDTRAGNRTAPGPASRALLRPQRPHAHLQSKASSQHAPTQHWRERRRRRLEFHGSRSAISVNASMAFSWVDRWNDIQHMRRQWKERPETRPPSEGWDKYTMDVKIGLMLTDTLLASMEKRVAPYGYSFRAPRRLGPQTVLPASPAHLAAMREAAAG